MLPWILTIIALIGAWLNSKGNVRGFYFWLVSNTGFCIYNAYIFEGAMSLLFFVYFCITCQGIYVWKKKESEKKGS